MQRVSGIPLYMLLRLLVHKGRKLTVTDTPRIKDQLQFLRRRECTVPCLHEISSCLLQGLIMGKRRSLLTLSFKTLHPRQPFPDLAIEE